MEDNEAINVDFTTSVYGLIRNESFGEAANILEVRMTTSALLIFRHMLTNDSSIVRKRLNLTNPPDVMQHCLCLVTAIFIIRNFFQL